MITKFFDDFKLHKAKCIINLNDYIGKQLPAHRAGVYSCPFQVHTHDDTHPGLKVKNNRVVCFKCGFEPLDIVGWLEKYENLSTFEAIKKTLELAGMEDVLLDKPQITDNFPEIEFGKMSVNIASIYIKSLSYSSRKIADLLHIKLDNLPQNIGVIDSNDILIPYFLRAPRRVFLVVPVMISETDHTICGIYLRFLLLDSSNRLIKDNEHTPKCLHLGSNGVWIPLHSEGEAGLDSKKYHEVEGISDIPPFLNNNNYNVKVMFGIGNFSSNEIITPDIDKAGITACLRACKGFISIGDKKALRDSTSILKLFVGAYAPMEILPSIFLFCKDLYVLDLLFKSMLVAARMDEDCYCALATLIDKADVSITGFAQQKIDFFQQNDLPVAEILSSIHEKFDDLHEKYQHFLEYQDEYISKIRSSMKIIEFRTGDHNTYLFKKQIINDLAATIPNGFDDYKEPTLLMMSRLCDGVPSGSIILLGGDTGTKKTSITLRIIADLSVYYKVSFFSLEEKLYYMKKRLELYSHTILSNINLTPNIIHVEFIALYVAVEARKGARFIVIDHANFLKDESLLENAMHKLNEVAKRFDVVIFIVAQMLKNIDTKKHPVLSYEQLYGGGAIKTYAHMIFIVQKYKIIYNNHSGKEEVKSSPHIANVKNRYGELLNDLKYFTKKNKLIDFI